jgi:hypothetical protein
MVSSISNIKNLEGQLKFNSISSSVGTVVLSPRTFFVAVLQHLIVAQSRIYF